MNDLSQRLRSMAAHTGLDAVADLLVEAADKIDAVQPETSPESGAAPAWKLSPVQARAVNELLKEITHALLEDKKQGGYDPFAGLFGPSFLALVRRWAAITPPNPDEYNRRQRAQLEQEWADVRRIRDAQQPQITDAMIDAANRTCRSQIYEQCEHEWEPSRCKSCRDEAAADLMAAFAVAPQQQEHDWQEQSERTTRGWMDRALKAERQLEKTHRWAIAAGVPPEKLDALAQQPAPGMAVQALAGEIVEALLADEKDGGFDLTAGMFGPAFSNLVRRWAAAEFAVPAPGVAVQKVRDAAALLRTTGPFDVGQVLALLDDALAQQPAPQSKPKPKPVARIYWPLNGGPLLGWYSNAAMEEAILKTHEGHTTEVPLYVQQPAPQPPQEVVKVAKAMQKDGYRGPLAWAKQVIDWVADQPTQQP